MKTLPLLLVLRLAPPLGAEENPLKWASHRRVADVLSTAAVATTIGAEIISSVRAQDRKKALGCELLRNGITVGAAELTKTVVHRTRPDGSDRKSFFSEHTALAAVNTGWRFGVSVPIAVGAGYGRMAADKHYVTDVLTGAMVGTLARFACSGR